jgi:glycosyltransferase involved in cell wall biosynthesis
MRVLWLSPGFPADEQDLNCLPPLQQLALEISTQGIDLQIITLGYPFHSKTYLWHGIPVVSGYGFNQGRFRWLNWARVVRHAQAAQQRQKFDLIHSFWLGPAWLIGRFLQSQWAIPHVTTLMGQDVLSTNWYRHLLCPEHAASMVAVSDFQHKIFAKTTGQQAAQTIPWGVVEQEIPHLLPENRPLDILGCGSLIPLKNWALWLQIVAEMAKSKPDIRAELIGEGVERPVLEALIRQLGLSRNVCLRGHLPRLEVLARMKQSKVFLHTANFESFGMVMAEAAMNGCRVLSTPVGVAPQIASVGHSFAELVKQVAIALNKPLLTTPNRPVRMADTAKCYLDLYRSRV